MKIQLRKPSCDRARYSEEYTKDALELWRNSGCGAPKVAAEPRYSGGPLLYLYRWVRLRAKPTTAKLSSAK